MTYCTCEEKFCHVNCYGSLCSDIWEKSAIHLFFLILEGFWLAAYLSQPIRRGKKYDLTGFFENTRWRKLFQNCTIFQFLHPYEFCLYLFLRGVNGKGWNWLNYAINFSFNANPMGVKLHKFFFSWKHNRIISRQQQKNVIMDNLWEFLLPNFPNPKKIWKIYMKNGRL